MDFGLLHYIIPNFLFYFSNTYYILDLNGAIESLESTVITDHVTDTTNLDHPDPCPDQKVFSFSHIFKFLSLTIDIFFLMYFGILLLNVCSTY